MGGAVIVQVDPAQVNAGKIVREPIEFPWVLEDAALMMNIVIRIDDIWETHHQQGLS